MSKSFSEFMGDLVDDLWVMGITFALILAYLGFYVLFLFALFFLVFGYYLWALLSFLGWVASIVGLIYSCEDNDCPF